MILKVESSVLRVDGLLNPVQVIGDACDHRVWTLFVFHFVDETVDSDECPVVLMVFAHERTPTITLHTTRNAQNRDLQTEFIHLFCS